CWHADYWALDSTGPGGIREAGIERIAMAFQRRVSARLSPHALMLALTETNSYHLRRAPASAGIGRLSALVAKSIVTTAVMSAAENLFPATKGLEAKRASRSR